MSLGLKKQRKERRKDILEANKESQRLLMVSQYLSLVSASNLAPWDRTQKTNSTKQKGSMSKKSQHRLNRKNNASSRGPGKQGRVLGIGDRKQAAKMESPSEGAAQVTEKLSSRGKGPERLEADLTSKKKNKKKTPPHSHIASNVFLFSH